MTTTYLDPSQVPASLRVGYDGRRFEAVVTDKAVNVGGADAHWSGGSRHTFEVLELATGHRLNAQTRIGDGLRPLDQWVSMERGFVLICHMTHGGKDRGLRFYVHPLDVNGLQLPMPGEVPRMMKIVLVATRSLKPSYNGQSEFRRREAMRETGISHAEWDAAKRLCTEAGFLNAAGALTTKGKNLAGTDSLWKLRPEGHVAGELPR